MMRGFDCVVNRKSREELRTLGNGDFDLQKDIALFIEQLEHDKQTRLEQAIANHRKQGSASYFGDVFGYE